MNFRFGLLALLLGYAILTVAVAADCCGPTLVPIGEPKHLEKGFSGSLFYEHMNMSTLLQGSKRVSGRDIINKRLSQGASSYSIPTDMQMDRLVLGLRYQLDNNQSLNIAIPWRINQMDMAMMSRPSATAGGHAQHQTTSSHEHANPPVEGMGNMGGMSGMGGMNNHSGSPMWMEMGMPQVDGLGDITLGYRYQFLLDKQLMWAGINLSLPTGSWKMRGSSGQLIHAMMQPGSGSLGFQAELGADLPLGESSFSLHPYLSAQYHGRNPLGYKQGTRLDFELASRYRLNDTFKLGLDLSGFILAKDSSNGTLDPVTREIAFQRPLTSLVDDVTNTGGSFIFLAPGLQISPSKSISLGFQYRIPIYQHVRGTQLGQDGIYRAYLSAKF